MSKPSTEHSSMQIYFGIKYWPIYLYVDTTAIRPFLRGHLTGSRLCACAQVNIHIVVWPINPESCLCETVKQRNHETVIPNSLDPYQLVLLVWLLICSSGKWSIWGQTSVSGREYVNIQIWVKPDYVILKNSSLWFFYLALVKP